MHMVFTQFYLLDLSLRNYLFSLVLKGKEYKNVHYLFTNLFIYLLFRTALICK